MLYFNFESRQKTCALDTHTQMSGMISSVSRIEKYDSSDALSIYDNQKDVVGEQSNVKLFRKYLLTKGHGKRVEDGICDQPTRSLSKFSDMQLHPKLDFISRPSTLLEQHLLPVLQSNTKLPNLCDEKSSTAQLTIFYAGAVSVYDHVPTDQAQAIMLLAGGTNVSPPPTVKINNTVTMKDAAAKGQHNHQPTSSSSLCKLQADLPLARKISLQYFLQKRRTRITNRSPYATPSSSRSRHEGEEENEKLKQVTYNDNNGVVVREDISSSKSPFPSELGFLFPTNKTGS